MFSFLVSVLFVVVSIVAVHFSVGLLLKSLLSPDEMWKYTYVYLFNIKRIREQKILCFYSRIRIFLWEMAALEFLLNVAEGAIRTTIVYAREVRRAVTTVLKSMIKRNK